MIGTRRSLWILGPLALSTALLASGLTRPAVRAIGYTERVRLGALGSIALDHTVVAEIRGDTSPYLRGRTLTRYRDGLWLPEEDRDARPVEPGGAATHRSSGRDGAAVFLPLGARLSVPRAGLASMRADGTFVVDPSLRELEFRVDEARAEALDPDALSLPRGLRAALARHARALAGKGPPRARAERLRRALAERKSYRLDFEPRPSVDPVLDFVERAEGGHCELFASAYVLLARSLGIPARLVSGYYASERVPERSLSRARRSDAHAWAEVYVDGRYRTVDPTPPQRSKRTTM